MRNRVPLKHMHPRRLRVDRRGGRWTPAVPVGMRPAWCPLSRGRSPIGGRPQRRHRVIAHERLPTHRGRDLACYCPLNEPCHADVLLATDKQDHYDAASP